MKKTLAVLLVLVLAFTMVGCGRSPIASATGCTAEQAAAIEQILSDVGVSYETIEKTSAEDDMALAALAPDYSPYLVTDGAGVKYWLILRTEDMTVAGIADVTNLVMLYGDMNDLIVRPA